MVIEYKSPVTPGQTFAAFDTGNHFELTDASFGNYVSVKSKTLKDVSNLILNHLAGIDGTTEYGIGQNGQQAVTVAANAIKLQGIFHPPVDGEKAVGIKSTHYFGGAYANEFESKAKPITAATAGAAKYMAAAVNGNTIATPVVVGDAEANYSSFLGLEKRINEPLNSHDIVATDYDAYIRCTALTGATTAVIPTDAELDLPIGFRCKLVSLNNLIIVDADNAVTVNDMRSIQQRAVLVKVGANEWDLID
jgi:hypothetical protein